VMLVRCCYYDYDTDDWERAVYACKLDVGVEGLKQALCDRMDELPEDVQILLLVDNDRHGPRELSAHSWSLVTHLHRVIGSNAGLDDDEQWGLGGQLERLVDGIHGEIVIVREEETAEEREATVLKYHSYRLKHENDLRAERAQAREAARRQHVQRAAAARERETIIRAWRTEVRDFLATQLDGDAADLILRIAALQLIQAHARGRAVRTGREWPWRKLQLKVVTQDGAEVFFKLKFNTRLGRVMNAFCQRNGMSIHNIRFLFDGNRIHENQTPTDLDMEDGDVIDVVVAQMGD